MSSSVRTAHFVVTGEFLTSHARQLWADEHEPRRAVEILLTGLQGIELGQAIGILTGRSQLVGDSDAGVELIDDDATLSPCGAELPSLSDVFTRLQQRIEVAERDASDLLALEADEGLPMTSPYGLRKVSPQTRDELAAGEIRWEDVRVYRDMRTYERRSYLKRQAADEVLEAAPPAREPLASFPAITTDSGWLAPDGRFYPCEYSEHVCFASRICSERQIDCGPLAEQTLEKLGWIKLAGRHGVLEGDRKPTDKQRSRVLDWCLGAGSSVTKRPWWLDPEEE